MRQLILGLGLLLLVGATPGLGLISTWQDGTADQWSTAGSWDNGVPGVNDTAVFDGTGAGRCTVDMAAACNRLVMSHASASIHFLAAQTLTIGAGGFSFTDGFFNDDGEDVVVGGSCIITSPASLTLSGTWTLTGTGNVENATAINAFNSLVVSGVVTRTGHVYCKSIEVTEGDTLAGAYTLYVRAAGNDCISTTGAIAGVIVGGRTLWYLAAPYTQGDCVLNDSIKVYGYAMDDTATLTGYLTAGGVDISVSMTFVDSGYPVTSAGSIVIHDTGVSVKSTGVWTQTASGVCVHRRPANVLGSYFVTATCLDTIFYNPGAVDDSFTVSDTFRAIGTRGSTFLYGDPSGTLMFLPAHSTADACFIENIYAKNHKLRAIGCIPKGHMSGIQVRR